MPGPIYVITGRITRRDTHAGIHGLRVEAWDEDRSHDDYLGVDLTNRDGSFSIRFSESNFKTFLEGAPEVFLRIRDRDCRLIYDGRADRHRCGPGTHITINVELDPDALQWHLHSPVSWTEIDGPLVPDAVFDDIHEAIGLLPSSGAPFNELRLVECATPLLEVRKPRPAVRVAAPTPLRARPGKPCRETSTPPDGFATCSRPSALVMTNAGAAAKGRSGR